LSHHSSEIKITPIYRICFTGGPCAGKTTAITKLTHLIEKKGFRVFVVPETASILMKAGAMIKIDKQTPEQCENF